MGARVKQIKAFLLTERKDEPLVFYCLNNRVESFGGVPAAGWSASSSALMRSQLIWWSCSSNRSCVSLSSSVRIPDPTGRMWVGLTARFTDQYLELILQILSGRSFLLFSGSDPRLFDASNRPVTTANLYLLLGPNRSRQDKEPARLDPINQSRWQADLLSLSSEPWGDRDTLIRTFTWSFRHQ